MILKLKLSEVHEPKQSDLAYKLRIQVNGWVQTAHKRFARKLPGRLRKTEPVVFPHLATRSEAGPEPDYRCKVEDHINQ